jgi:hypothetical protein
MPYCRHTTCVDQEMKPFHQMQAVSHTHASHQGDKKICKLMNELFGIMLLPDQGRLML